jgi:uncharacterized protein (TIGR03083 family)
VITTPHGEVRAIDRREARVLATTENQRMVAQLAALTDDDWTKPTDCSGWTVRTIAGHVLGATEGFASMTRVVRLMFAAAKLFRGQAFVDAVSAAEIDATASLQPTQVVTRLTAAGPRSVEFRFGRSALFRAMPLRQTMPSGATEWWKFGYLLETILTRDTWMHRVDVARPAGQAPLLTPDHDGRIVADVVVEWAQRHGQPFTLELTGAAGGTFMRGTAGESICLDAVDFCRILSGRGTGHGLLSHEVGF